MIKLTAPLKSLLLLLILGLSLTLTACASLGIASLQRYADTKDGYEFLYPNGWIAVDVKGASPGVDVVFRDLIERSENLSVIISDIPSDKSLTDLGTPTEVGYRFLKKINADPEAGRQAELITAEQQTSNDKTYYKLEYRVTQDNQVQRHDLANVTTNRGKLITFNLSTTEDRWEKVEDLFNTVVSSFKVY